MKIALCHLELSCGPQERNLQLLEQAGKLDLQTLKAISELLRGSFTYTVLDSGRTLFLKTGSDSAWRCRG